MLDLNYFRFENKNIDFPFYSKNPYISKIDWILLFILILISIIAMALFDNEIIGSALAVLIIIIPILYYLDWDYRRIFQKPSVDEVTLAILLFIAYMIYAIIASSILDLFALSGSEIVSESYITITTIISLIPSLMWEELIKFTLFMFFLRLIFKYSQNRKLSIIFAMIIVMIIFGLMHLTDTDSLVSVLLIQGLGSIFEFYGYIKTKNLLIPYITHLSTDLFIFIFLFILA